MIWSNGITSYSKPPGSNSRSVRKAVVMVPGMAILTLLSSLIVSGFFETTIGPYLSPMLQPLGSRAYLSSTYE